MDNPTIADELLKQARTAAGHGANLYRVRALRRAALSCNHSIGPGGATILGTIGRRCAARTAGHRLALSEADRGLGCGTSPSSCFCTAARMREARAGICDERQRRGWR